MTQDPPQTVYRNRSTKKLHVEPDCGGELSAWDIEAVPPAWREWCLNCASHLTDRERAENEDNPHSVRCVDP